MISLLAWLGQRSRGALAIGFALAFVLPALADALRPLLPLTVAGLLVIATLRCDARALLGFVARPLPVVYLNLVVLIVSPLAVWLLTTLLGLTPSLTAALVLSASLPPLFSVPAMIVMLGLNVTLSLAVVLAATVVAPFTLAALAIWLLQMQLGVSPLELMLRLVGIGFGAVCAGVALRGLLGAERVDRLDAPLAGLMVLLLLVFAITVMQGVPGAFTADPMNVVSLIGIAFALNLGLQALAFALTLPLGAHAALSAGFVNGNRALGLLIAVLPATADPLLLLFMALGQFPIYLLPFIVARPYKAVLSHLQRARG